MSLRRRLDGVAKVAISQSEQTARIDLAAGAPTFVPAHFRTAIDESGLELVQMQVHACGAIVVSRRRGDGTIGYQRFGSFGRAVKN